MGAAIYFYLNFMFRFIQIEFPTRISISFGQYATERAFCSHLAPTEIIYCAEIAQINPRWTFVKIQRYILDRSCLIYFSVMPKTLTTCHLNHTDMKCKVPSYSLIMFLFNS